MYSLPLWPMLSNQVSHNVLVPPLGTGKDGRGHDQGDSNGKKLTVFNINFLLLNSEIFLKPHHTFIMDQN